MEAYNEGGDDYLVKPFSQTELLMKVKSLLRRYKEYYSRFQPQAVPTIGGNISLDTKTRAAVKGGKKIPLTDKEYDILRYFIEHRGEIVENKDLYGEGNITTEHVQNNTSVRQMLGQRGIRPEKLPAAEDVKNIERRVAGNEKKMEKTTPKLPKENME